MVNGLQQIRIAMLGISGLLVNICIAIPSTASPTTTGGAAGATTAATPQQTHNAAAVIAFQPWQLLFAVFGSLALL